MWFEWFIIKVAKSVFHTDTAERTPTIMNALYKYQEHDQGFSAQPLLKLHLDHLFYCKYIHLSVAMVT